MFLSNASTWSQLIVSSFEILLIVWGAIKLINKVSNKLDKLDTISDRLTKVELQYKPNGGSSMKDSVNRIEKQLEKLQDRLENHIDKNKD